MHIIMAGNPGVGKSFLLNSLAGKCLFPSGVTLGPGRTQNFLTARHNGLTLSDTPGLDDIVSRSRAAEEISTALDQGGTFKLVFVVVLQSGRVRTEDVTTIRLILQALDRALARRDAAGPRDTAGRFAVLVNKCGPQVLAQLRQPANQEIIRAYLSTTHAVQHLGYLPYRADAMDQENLVLSCPADLRAFIDAAPTLTVPPVSRVRVDASRFDPEHDRLRAQLDDLNERIDGLPPGDRASQSPVLLRLLKEAVPSLVLGIGGQILGGLAAARLVPVLGPALARAVTYIGQALRFI